MNKETISQIKARLQTITDTTDPYLQTIHDDSRKGVQTAIQQFERRLARQKEAEEARSEEHTSELQSRETISYAGSNTKSTIGKMDVSILQGWMK